MRGRSRRSLRRGVAAGVLGLARLRGWWQHRLLGVDRRASGEQEKGQGHSGWHGEAPADCCGVGNRRLVSGVAAAEEQVKRRRGPHLQAARAVARKVQRAERDPAQRAKLLAISPLTRASEIRIPLMVVTGANDPRVPKSEADQMVRAVRAMAVKAPRSDQRGTWISAQGE